MLFWTNKPLRKKMVRRRDEEDGLTDDEPVNVGSFKQTLFMVGSILGIISFVLVFIFLCVLAAYLWMGIGLQGPLSTVQDKVEGFDTREWSPDIEDRAKEGKHKYDEVARGDFYSLARMYVYGLFRAYDTARFDGDVDIYDSSLTIRGEGDLRIQNGSIALADGHITSSCTNEIELRNTTGAGITAYTGVGLAGTGGLAQSGFSQFGPYVITDDILASNTSTCTLTSATSSDGGALKTVTAYFDDDGLLTLNVTWYNSTTKIPTTFTGTYQPEAVAFTVRWNRKVVVACHGSHDDSFLLVWQSPNSATTVKLSYIQITDYTPLTMTSIVSGPTTITTTCLTGAGYVGTDNFFVMYTTGAAGVIRNVAVNTGTYSITLGTAAVIDADLANSCNSMSAAVLSSSSIAVAYVNVDGLQNLDVVEVAVSGATYTPGTAATLYTLNGLSEFIYTVITSLGAGGRFWIGFSDTYAGIYGRMTTGQISAGTVTFATPNDNYLTYGSGLNQIFQATAVAPHGTNNAEQAVVLCTYNTPVATSVNYGCRKIDYHNGALLAIGEFAQASNIDIGLPGITTLDSDTFVLTYVTNSVEVTGNTLLQSVGIWDSSSVINFNIEYPKNGWGVALQNSTANGYGILVQTSGCITNPDWAWTVNGLPIYLCGDGTLNEDPACGGASRTSIPIPAAVATSATSIRLFSPVSVDPVVRTSSS